MTFWGRRRAHCGAALAGALVVLLLAPTANGAAADPPPINQPDSAPARSLPLPTPAPTTGAQDTVYSTKSDSPALRRARFAAYVASLPMRVFHAPRQSDDASATVNSRQAVLVGALRANGPYAPDAHYCADHPFLLDHVSGDVTPGGTITVTGACFGSAAGQVQMLGNFPNANGRVSLAVQSWTAESVIAKIPAIPGAPDQAVDIRLQRYISTTSVRGKGVPQIVSVPVRMSFLAERQEVNASSRVETLSCGRLEGSPWYDELMPDAALCINKNVLSYFPDVSNRWPDGYKAAAHQQRAPDSGTDTWHVRLPTGWRFDRIVLLGDGDVVIDPTLDPTNVIWSVGWHTTPTRVEILPHILSENPFNIAFYAFALFAVRPRAAADPPRIDQPDSAPERTPPLPPPAPVPHVRKAALRSL